MHHTETEQVVQYGIEIFIPGSPDWIEAVRDRLDEAYTDLAQSAQSSALQILPALDSGLWDHGAELILTFVGVPGETPYDAISKAGAVLTDLFGGLGIEAEPAARVLVAPMEYFDAD